jgi:adenylate kinase
LISRKKNQLGEFQKGGFAKKISSENDKCPICGSDIAQRIDDTPERIKTRLGIYRKDTQEVLAFYRDKGLLIEIDGTPSIEEVQKNILAELEKRGLE